MKKIIFLVFVIFLNGCVGPTQGYNGPDLYRGESLNDSGYLLASMSINKKQPFYSPFYMQEIIIRKVGYKEEVSLKLIAKDYDFKESDNRGIVFAELLVPGNYELFGACFYYQSYKIHETFCYRDEFSIPFKIEKGKSIYIGEFRSFAKWKNWILDFSIPDQGYFEYRMTDTRDFPLLVEKIGVNPESILINRLPITGQEQRYIIEKSTTD